MEQRSVSPETQAAQGLGEADPASGGLAPVINLSTNYEQQLDGSYPQGRIYTRADNPTCEHAERLLGPGGLRLRLRAVRLGDGGSHRGIPVTAAGRSCAGLPGLVLGSA